MDADLERIVAKLRRARERGLTCFGSRAHEFRLNRPLDEATVAAFERAHGVRLPDGYRRFVTQAGDGGAGPYYGIEPLARRDDRDGARTWRTTNLARPCLLYPELVDSPDWVAAIADPDDPCQGTLGIAQQGCAGECVLVVTGPHAGRVVHVYMDLLPEVPPFFTDDVDFLAWYERWLDEVLAGRPASGFDRALPGDEADYVAIARDAACDERRRARAVWSMLRLTALGPDAEAVVLEALRSGRARMRENAAHVAAHFALARAEGALRGALDDDDAQVRKAALEALAKLPGVAWEDDARRMLRDREHDVVLRAVCGLRDRGALRLDDAAPLLVAADARTRQTAAWALGGLRDARAIDAVAPLLDDEDPPVRVAAAQSLRAHAGRDDAAGRASPAVDALVARLRVERDGLVALNLALALLETRDARADAALEEALRDEARPEVRARVAEALERARCGRREDAGTVPSSGAGSGAGATLWDRVGDAARRTARRILGGP